MTDAEHPTMTLTYLGRRALQGGKKGSRWLDEATDTRYLFAGSDRHPIGGKYVWEILPDDKFRKGDYVGLSTSDQLLIWKAEADAFEATETMAAAEKAAKKLVSDQMGDLTLNQCKDLLRGRMGPNRDAMLAIILRYMGGSW